MYVPPHPLLKRETAITVTNACNLWCGNCFQHCQIFKNKPEEIWHIPLPQLKQNIDILIESPLPRKLIGLWGGEPCVHPQWKEILELIASYPQNMFQIYTNGIARKQTFPPNTICNDSKKNLKSVRHQTVLEAPIDILKNQTPASCWELAKRNCNLWCVCGCTCVYDNRLFFCQVAAAFDRLELGQARWNESVGWPLTGPKAYLRSMEEIDTQALKWCYRCGLCMKGNKTGLFSKTSVSNTNLPLVGKGRSSQRS